MATSRVSYGEAKVFLWLIVRIAHALILVLDGLVEYVLGYTTWITRSYLFLTWITMHVYGDCIRFLAFPSCLYVCFYVSIC